MYCTSCGVQIEGLANYCPQCGHQTANGAARMPRPQQLTRYLPGKMIAGVCAGMARYLNLDTALVRLLWIALFFLPVPGALIAYIVAWIILPVERTPAPMAYPLPAAQ